jgi:hypothetical protein
MTTGDTDRPPSVDSQMDSMSVLYFSSALLVCFAVAIAAAFIAGSSFWRRNRFSAVATTPGGSVAASKIVYHDAPTVRVAESQRVDRVRKVLRLAVGEHVDVLETYAGLTPRFRVKLKSIERRGENEFAHIGVEFGGTRLSCGPAVEETGVNEFAVPRSVRDEPRSSVFHYREHGNSLEFMRIKVRSLDATANVAELDLMQVDGRWPGNA